MALTFLLAPPGPALLSLAPIVKPPAATFDDADDPTVPILKVWAAGKGEIVDGATELNAFTFEPPTPVKGNAEEEEEEEEEEDPPLLKENGAVETGTLLNANPPPDNGFA